MSERISDSSADNSCSNNNEEGNRFSAADAASVSDGTESASTSHPDSKSISLEMAQEDDVDWDRICQCACTLRYCAPHLSDEEVAEHLAKWRAKPPPSESEPVHPAIDKLAGMSAVMDTAWDTIKLPLDCPDNCRRPSRGLILHGESGVGKTLLMKALKERCNRNDPKISVFEYMYFKDEKDELVKLFDAAQKRRPSIIFIDWFVGVASHGSPSVETLGALMDGLDYCGSVFVVAATDCLDKIDPALRQSGRFDTEIFVQLPDLEARKDILYKTTAKCDVTPHAINVVANATSGYTGDDLDALCHAAFKNALVRTNYMINPVPPFRVELEDFKEALRTFE